MKCPECGKETECLRALSRVDNKTMICDECATNEALDDAGLREGSSIRGAILGCIDRGTTPQERTRAKVQATGNRWAIENFNETHN
jgi:protein-arginine kinase activator protein McsA